MAKRAGNKKIIGYVLLVVGIGCVIWGYQQSGSFGAQLNEAITGSQTDKVMLLYIGGAACLVAGFFLALRK